MSKIIFDQELLGIMDIIGRLIKVPIKDCFKEEGVLYCVVEKGWIGKAIGKGAVNIKKIENLVKMKVKLVEYGGSAVAFAHNFIYPVKVEEIVEVDGVVEIRDPDRRKKGLIFGRDGSNLKLITKAVRRFYDVEVKVV